MNKFIWKEEYSVGIPSIDDQHKHFFDIANKMIDLAEQEAPSRDTLVAAISELGDYALYHLKTEEKYFDEFAYKGAREHVAVHDLYREKIADYLEAAHVDETDIAKLAEEAAVYSIDWLSHHILIMDKKYTEFLEERGVV